MKAGSPMFMRLPMNRTSNRQTRQSVPLQHCNQHLKHKNQTIDSALLCLLFSCAFCYHQKSHGVSVQTSGNSRYEYFTQFSIVVYRVANWRFRSGSGYQSAGSDPVPVFEHQIRFRFRVPSGYFRV